MSRMNEIIPPPMLTPPTEPGRIPARSGGPAWARVIGIISIVLGSLGALGGAWNAIGAALAPAFMGWMPQDDAAFQAMQAAMRKWMPWQVAVGVALFLVAGVLLASGVGMVKCRGWSVRAAWVWIVLKVLAVTGSAVVTGLHQRDQMQAMAQAGTPMPTGMAGGMALASAILYWLWGMVYPAFLCVWLARPSIRKRTRDWP